MARNVPAPHPASRHATARVPHATRCEFASSSRPDAAPSAAPTKTRRDVPKSSRELRKKSQLSAKNGAFSSRLLHPAARTPRLERHGAPFSVCTGHSPWRAPRRNTVCAHRITENRKENYSRNRSFYPFHERNCSIFPFRQEINKQNRPHVQKNTYLWPTYLCVLRTARPQRAGPTQITSHKIGRAHV